MYERLPVAPPAEIAEDLPAETGKRRRGVTDPDQNHRLGNQSIQEDRDRGTDGSIPGTNCCRDTSG